MPRASLYKFLNTRLPHHELKIPRTPQLKAPRFAATPAFSTHTISTPAATVPHQQSIDPGYEILVGHPQKNSFPVTALSAMATGASLLYPVTALAEGSFLENIQHVDLTWFFWHMAIVFPATLLTMELLYQVQGRYYPRLVNQYQRLRHLLVNPFPPQDPFRIDARQAGLIKEYFPGGIRQTPLKQRGIGDCYLIGYYHPLKLHPIAQRLFEYMFRADSRDQVQVKFLGLDKAIPVRRSDLRDHVKVYNPEKNKWVEKQYVSGALGDNVIEMAFALALSQAGSGNRQAKSKKGMAPELVMEGGWARDAFQFFISAKYGIHEKIDAFTDHFRFGTFAESSRYQKEAEKILVRYAKKPLQFILSASTPSIKTAFFDKGSDEYGETRTYYYMDAAKRFPTQHAYSVIHVDEAERTVVVVNPHDTSKEIQLSFEDFFKIFGGLESTELNFDRLQQVLGPLDFLKPQEGIQGALTRNVQYGYRLDPYSDLEIVLGAQYKIKAAVKGGKLFLTGSGLSAPLTQGIVAGKKVELGRRNIQGVPATVSMKHLSLELKRNGTLVVSDAGSMNGTHVKILYNAQRGGQKQRYQVVRSSIPSRARPGVYQEVLEPHEDYVYDLSKKSPTIRLASTLLQAAIEQGELVLTNPNGGQRFVVPPNHGLPLGRRNISPPDNSISGTHTNIIFGPNLQMSVRDLGSTNKTMVESGGHHHVYHESPNGGGGVINTTFMGIVVTRQTEYPVDPSKITRVQLTPRSFVEIGGLDDQGRLSIRLSNGREQKISVGGRYTIGADDFREDHGVDLAHLLVRFNPNRKVVITNQADEPVYVGGVED